MNTTNDRIKNLAGWIDALKEAAKKDEQFSISWFADTKDKPFSIIGGWMEGFSESYSDILCISKSEPKYAMCVKIATNEGPYAYTDFEIMDMPVDTEGYVDDTCIALEYDDNSESLAEFLLIELDRISREYSK
jgi:hypothetical protein